MLPNKFVFIGLMLAFVFCSAFSDKNAKPKPVLRDDSSVVDVRKFDADHLAAYSRMAEFQYKEPVEGPSFWMRFWRWVWSLFDFTPNKNHHVSKFWHYLIYFLKYLFIALGIASFVFLILKLIGIDISSIFKRKAARAGIPYSELLENIHDIDFDNEIEKAVALRNYRAAVRLLYLSSLKHLSDAGMIDWQISKTNNTYIYEIANEHLRKVFKQLTLQFEYVWYGEFLIDQHTYQRINTLYLQFKKDAV